MKWFDTKEVDSFAQWVVSELTQRLPPATLETDDRKLPDRIRRMNEFISGRATRGMDRFSIKRIGNEVVVDIAAMHQDDQDHAGWVSAVVAL